MVEPVTFAPCGWNDGVARDVAVIADDETPLEWYAARVAALQLAALAVFVGSKRAGSVLWKIDEEAGDRCFVIVAAVGSVRGFDLTYNVLPAFERWASVMGCKRIRFHTTREGLVAKAQHIGYRVGEFVMRKRLP